ncbi:hypothetical protein [Deinococcus yavapaiensis]|uniref:Uncharacterized protein n=1 Tax=Deinococcus yavapaiensis KR-236 TaxID=694435 RepID=A0A318S062_9DEIO|nr:hypothetical protein [Deinococcus yavapaiensis]PYE49955.1 hypothetical protein DES52_12040 [Deinococcus yavapaiensis KR-236]
MLNSPLSSWFYAQPHGSGFTLTLPTRLARFLHAAQHHFGLRDPSFTLLGVEFGPHPFPRLWHPGVPERSVIVQLSHLTRGAVDLDYQLAHEAVHLLRPPFELRASVLEEGVATWFATQVVREDHACAPQPDTLEYARALELVAPLLDRDAAGIARLRARNASLSAVTAEDILAVWPEVGESLAHLLARPFECAARPGGMVDGSLTDGRASANSDE